MATRNGEVGQPRHELMGKPHRDKNKRKGRKYPKLTQRFLRKYRHKLQQR